MMRQAAPLLLLALAAPAAAEPLACGEGEIEAVQRVTRYESNLSDFTTEDPSQIIDIIDYFSADGRVRTERRGKALLPTGVAADGSHILAWQSSDSDIWEVGEHVYTWSRINGGENHSRRKRTAPDFDPSIAIEDIPPDTPDTTIQVGHRCRLAREAAGPGPAKTVCNLKVYGRNRHLDSKIEADGFHQTFRTRSLTQLCIDASMLEPPDFNWK